VSKQKSSMIAPSRYVVAALRHPGMRFFDIGDVADAQGKLVLFKRDVFRNGNTSHFTYLSGIGDRGKPFAVRVHPYCKTVSDACRYLVPVRFKSNRHWVRQGDVYIAPSVRDSMDAGYWLPKSHVWNRSTRTLTHIPSDPAYPPHEPLYLQYPCTFDVQRLYYPRGR